MITMKTIKIIVGMFEATKQKNIKRIVSRLKKMSPSDVATLFHGISGDTDGFTGQCIGPYIPTDTPNNEPTNIKK